VSVELVSRGGRFTLASDQAELILALLTAHGINLLGHLQAIRAEPALGAVAAFGVEAVEEQIALVDSCFDALT